MKISINKANPLAMGSVFGLFAFISSIIWMGVMLFFYNAANLQFGFITKDKMIGIYIIGLIATWICGFIAGFIAALLYNIVSFLGGRFEFEIMEK